MKSPLQAILIAGEESQRDVVEGKKQITIREGYRSYQVGGVMLCCPETSFCVEANISSVRHCPAHELTPGELRADGYETLDLAVQGIRRFYPEFNRNSETTVVMWDSVRGKLAGT